MPAMLLYLFIYLLAAVLLFQGLNLLGEQRTPTGVIPPEVRPRPAAAARWGRLLVAYGIFLAVLALCSHVCPWLPLILVSIRDLGFGVLAVYGLWLVFGRKVDYTPAPPSKEAHGHSH
jgi:hypothetical protein